MSTMTPADALRALGLDAHPGLEMLRRVYLRTWSQQQGDAASQIRDAYRLLSSWPHLGPAHEPWVEQERRASDAPGGAYRAASAGSLLTTLGRTDDARARHAMLEHAVEAQPDERWIWEELAFELEHAGRRDDAVATLRRGIERGHAGLRRQLVERHPDALDHAELAAARGGDAPAVAIAIALAARGEVDEAERLLIAAASDEHEEPATRWGELVLVLIERGDADAAKRVWTTFDEARSEADEEPAYRLTAELAAVHAGVPSEVRAALARALRAGDVRLARDALVSFAERHGVAARARVRRVLDGYAPGIAAAVGDVVWREPPPANVGVPISFVLLLVFGAAAGIRELAAGPEVYEDPATVRELLDRVQAYRAEPDDPLARISAALREDAVASFCEDEAAEPCAVARAWARALEDGDCASAADALAQLLGGDATLDADTAELLRDAQRMGCP